DLDGPVAEFDQDGAQVGAIIDAVGKEMTQPWKQVVDSSDDQPGTVTILDVGRVNRDTDQQAGGVGDDVALAALALLGRIVAARPAAFGGLDRLAVDPPRPRARL